MLNFYLNSLVWPMRISSIFFWFRFKFDGSIQIDFEVDDEEVFLLLFVHNNNGHLIG